MDATTHAKRATRVACNDTAVQFFSHFFQRRYLLLAESLQLYHTTKRKIAVHPYRARLSDTNATTLSLASLTLPRLQPPPSPAPPDPDGSISGSVVAGIPTTS